jgi:DNA-binding NarL/FixJ family response regulator
MRIIVLGISWIIALLMFIYAGISFFPVADIFEAMVGKRKQMSTPQKQVVISLFEDGVNQHRIAEILGVS